ncbi:putative ATP-grasp-modified RiPP [Amycolatopsis antarctica]|nr:putative ATP-grasp-modified RiPP [Amycolatopsis antarctica]
MPAATDPSDPIASHSARFPLDGFSTTPRPADLPAPAGLRPFGLRRACGGGTTRRLPSHSYDPVRQLAVDLRGRPLVELSLMGDPTAERTGHVDGEDEPSSTDWIND